MYKLVFTFIIYRPGARGIQRKARQKTLPSLYRDFPRFFGFFKLCEKSESSNGKFGGFFLYFGRLFPLKFFEFLDPFSLFFSSHPAILFFKSSWIPRMPWNIFYISWQHACVPRVAMKYKIYTMAHAVLVGLSEIPRKITRSRGIN